VLFLVGEHDMITPADLIEMCAGLLPTARYYMARGSGHSVYWEKPEEFNEVALRYLLEIDGIEPPPD
jgi:pimeloyl-ACP methyl ester carboxylesterase